MTERLLSTSTLSARKARELASRAAASAPHHRTMDEVLDLQRRKIRKFRRDPQQFLLDSRYKSLRVLGRRLAG